MKTRTRLPSAARLAFGALTLMAGVASGDDPHRPGVGEMAPAFSLPASNRTSVSLADFRDKRTVVLAFFPKAFTFG